MTQTENKSLNEQQEDGNDLGNFYPTHHIVLAFDTAEQAQTAYDALTQAGFKEIRRFTDKQMQASSQRGLDTAGLIAAMGSSLKMVELHHRLASEGCHFLMVKAPSDDDTERLMKEIRKQPFRLAQKYHRLVIQTLE